jgi:two-component sensor histidine kinase
MSFQPLKEQKQLHSDYKNGVYKLLRRLSWVFSGLFVLLAFVIYPLNTLSSLFYIVTAAISVFSLIYLYRNKETKLIFWIFSIAGSGIVIYSMHTLHSMLHYSDILWTACTVIFAYIGLGRKIGSILLVLHMISLSLFYVFSINLHIQNLNFLTPFEIYGGLVEILISLFSLTYLIILYLKIQNYTELKLIEANEKLTQKNGENLILLKEIHHRIKNNLQLVISLLRMQKEELNSPEMKHQFNEAIHRIMSISLIHQKLYENENLKRFELIEYIEELITEIKSLSPETQDIDLKLDIQVNAVGMKTIVPLGLILNELITNSFKHAFKSTPQKEIYIHIHSEVGQLLKVKYNDSGTWIENQKPGFGSELIELLVEQMDGNFIKKESEYTFVLQNLDLD